MALAKQQGLFSKDVIAIAAGTCHIVVCTGDGVLSYGRGFAGQLGHGGFEDEHRPRLIEIPKMVMIDRRLFRKRFLVAMEINASISLPSWLQQVQDGKHAKPATTQPTPK